MGLLLISFLLFVRRIDKLKKQQIEDENTEILAKNAKLEELDEIKSHFFTNVSHELRTPLTLIGGPLEQVLSDEKSGIPPKSKNLLKLSMVNTRKLHSKINEILDLSKVEAGKLTLDLKPMAVNSFFQRMTYAFESLTYLRKISLSFTSKLADDLQLLLDSDKVEKVVNNLLSNAIKHSPNGSEIQLYLSAANGIYTVTVKDEGLGIDTAEKENIFDRFYQSKEGKLHGGTGIGLTLSRELARLLDGNLVVKDSETGGVFEFTFKTEAATESDIALHTSVSEDENTSLSFDIETEFGERPSVLVIEDNPDMRAYIKNILQSPFKIYEAADGAEGLNMLETHKIDLITSDITMPNQDGFELLNRVKSDKRFRTIPIIMLTARAEEQDKLKALNEGVDDYIIKPFYARELKARVKNLLQNAAERSSHNLSPKESAGEEETFMKKVKEYALEHISNNQFDVHQLAEKMHCSTTTLNRKTKTHIGLTGSAYIKELRLSKAYSCLISQSYDTVAVVSESCGFTRPGYFTKEFYKRYGKNPSDFF